MNPFRIFGVLRGIATRWPILTVFVAVWFLGEAANVLDAIDVGRPVWIFGHLSSDLWQASEEELWLVIYAGGLGVCGVVLLGLAIFGKRSQGPAGVTAPAPPAGSAIPKPTHKPTQRPTPAAPPRDANSAGGAIVWRRKVKEVRPNRLGR
jgi:hypothetical protein